MCAGPATVWGRPLPTSKPGTGSKFPKGKPSQWGPGLRNKREFSPKVAAECVFSGEHMILEVSE